MFYIPTGIILSKGVNLNLSWKAFIFDNLIPVTLGNIVGGGLLIGLVYYYLHSEYLSKEVALEKRNLKWWISKELKS